MNKREKEAESAASSRYQPHIIFVYSTSHLSGTGKTRFHYALKGRYGKKGMLEKVKAEPVGRAAILVNKESASTVESFLNEWKCVFQCKEVFLQ